jgi:hypothetical protein
MTSPDVLPEGFIERTQNAPVLRLEVSRNIGQISTIRCVAGIGFAKPRIEQVEGGVNLATRGVCSVSFVRDESDASYKALTKARPEVNKHKDAGGLMIVNPRILCPNNASDLSLERLEEIEDLLLTLDDPLTTAGFADYLAGAAPSILPDGERLRKCDRIFLTAVADTTYFAVRGALEIAQGHQ